MRPPPKTRAWLRWGTRPGSSRTAQYTQEGLSHPGTAIVPALIATPQLTGLPATASASENKPWGRNTALCPGFAGWLLRGETKREEQLTLSKEYALPNESRPRSYAGVAPIPRQASTPLKASDGDRQPPRKETPVGNFALMPARQLAPAPGRRRRKDCRLSRCSPACVYMQSRAQPEVLREGCNNRRASHQLCPA